MDAWQRLFAFSLVLALASCTVPAVFNGAGRLWSEILGVFIIFALPLAWTIIVVVAIIRHKTLGLWLLIGAPFALFWVTLLMLHVPFGVL